MGNEIDANYSLIPAGSIIAYAGKSIPQGWELCDGREVSKTDQNYNNLFDAIGNIWGGDGNPNFKLPNLKNQFLRGANSTNEVNTTGGSETHLHGGSTGGITGGGTYGVRDGGNSPPAATGTDHTHHISSDSQSNLPPYVDIIYLIKL